MISINILILYSKPIMKRIIVACSRLVVARLAAPIALPRSFIMDLR